MLDLLWLLPAFPLLGFLILALGGGALSKFATALLGAGTVGLSLIVAVLIAWAFLASGEEYFVHQLWVWMAVGNFTPAFAFHLDGLSLVMMLIVTGVGFLIHLYATGYMADDPGYARFFAYMNLFVAAMLVLVLADNLVLLYLGWEGVGLCSYLLIGFWYTDADNGYAARKAFVVTRVGDTSMAIGLFLLFTQLGTLNIQELLGIAGSQWSTGSGLAVAASLLLLGGAVGKSAQLPLQTWLPDAMAGPTPISALIHAATMVTAGVYLIARTHVLFELAPAVQILVAWVGLATLLMAGFTALTQSDIKRVLAWSTVSQIGYMFLGLGVGAWSAGIFHLMTHAFFKALLFLAAGTVILSLHHQQEIFRMGGMRRHLPVAFWSFLVGSLALTAFPFTSGYFSKDEILLAALELEGPGLWLWLGGVIGAFFTGLYTFRLLFLVFFGESGAHSEQSAGEQEPAGHGEGAQQKVQEVGGWHMHGPLFVLMGLSLLGGFISMPLDNVFGQHGAGEEHHVSALLHAFMIAMPLAGAGLAWLVYMGPWRAVGLLMAIPLSRVLHRYWFSGWGMDWLYDRLFVHPFLWLAHSNRKDLVDGAWESLAVASRAGHRLIARTQTGYLRWYALSIAAGLVLIVSLGVLL